MENPEEYIRKTLEAARDEIKLALKGQKVNARGVSSEGFRVRSQAGRVQLYYTRAEGAAPLETLESGRPAGKVPHNFVDIIEQWSRDKGLTFSSEKERRSFAGAVVFGKHIPKGWGRPAPAVYGGSERNYSLVVEQTAEKLREELENRARVWLTDKIFK